jgi:hypothetical protein
VIAEPRGFDLLVGVAQQPAQIGRTDDLASFGPEPGTELLDGGMCPRLLEIGEESDPLELRHD